MSEQDGGSAFPRIDVEHFPSGYGHGEHCETQNLPGMSLRDYFAGQALAGMMATRPAMKTDTKMGTVAFDCYLMADAMIAERVK